MERERYNDTWNNPGTISTTDQYHIISNIKVVFQNILKNYFDNLNTDFAKRDPAIQQFQFKKQFEAKPRSTEPIKIVREFPFENRDFPFVMVSLKDFKEKKLYLGWDNIGHLARHKTANGDVIGEIAEAQHFTAKAVLNIAAANIDERDMLINYLGIGFQNYFRSNYKWIHPDGITIFFIHVGYKEPDYNVEPNPIKDASGGNIFPVYTGSVGMECFVETYYRLLSSDYVADFRYTTESLGPDPFVPNDPEC